MSEPVECEVCGGFGNCPIIDKRGTQRYSIACPECFGIGTVEPEDIPEEPPEWPPASTAATVHTKEDLAQAVKRWNGCGND